MRSRLLRGAIAICLLLGACVSAPKRTTFSPQSASALLIVATPLRGGNRDVLRRVDLTSGTFVGAAIAIDVDTAPQGLTDALLAPKNQINANSTARTVALAVKEVPPGDYAWTESVRTVQGGYNFGWVGILCMNESSPVFSIAAGQIGVVRLDNVAIGRGGYNRPEFGIVPNTSSDESVLDDLNRSRADYPGIIGDAVLLHPTQLIHWPSQQHGFGWTRNCVEPGAFSKAQ